MCSQKNLNPYLILLGFFCVGNSFGQSTVVDWSTILTGCTGVVNTSNTPNAVVTISGSNFNNNNPGGINNTGACTANTAPYYLVSTGTANWAMTGICLVADWPNSSSNITVDITFTVPVCGDLTFVVHDLNGDAGSPFEDKITVNAWDGASVAIPVNSTNYSWTNCSANVCGGVPLFLGGNPAQANMLLGRGTNFCSNLNSYGCAAGQTTFTLKSPTSPNKIKRVQIVYTSACTCNDANAYYTGGDPGWENIIISNITAKPAPIPTASNLCVANVINLSSSSSGGNGTFSYSWSGPNSYSSASQNPTINPAGPLTAGTYVVTVTSNGCTNTASTTVSIGGGCTLPIQLISFNGKCNGNKKLFEWTTATEINNNFFTLQESKTGIDFSDLGKIAGTGNSSILKNYEAEFSSDDLEYDYFRLKQTDFNGNSSYSEIIYMNCASDYYGDVVLYPNPTSDLVNIKFNSPIETKIIYSVSDVFGREVKQGEFISIEKGEQLSINTEVLPAGVYFIKLHGIDNKISFPILKLVKE